MSERSDAKKGPEIQSLVRASALLREIARNRDGIGLAQLSRTLDLHTSTAFHLLKTLVHLGYVRQGETTKLYRIGSQIFNLAATASDEVEIAKLAEPFIDELAMRTGETSHLALRSGEEIVVVARSYGNTAFHFAERTGTTRPPHATAIGKALLAAMPQKNLEALVSKLELRAITPRTITDPQKLLEEIEKVRRTEIAYDDGEFHPELRCVAVHVRNFTVASPARSACRRRSGASRSTISPTRASCCDRPRKTCRGRSAIPVRTKIRLRPRPARSWP
jgi:DNA-binding IclR family transcriptional regulator